MVHDNAFGIVAQMEGPNQIARAIDELLSDPSRPACWRNAVSSGRSRYRWDHEAQYIREIVRGIAQGHCIAKGTQ